MVPQYLRMCSSARTDHYQASRQEQGPSQNQPTLAQQPSALLLVPNAQQIPLQPMAHRQQLPGACFNCGEPSHFLADCPLKDRGRKPVQQQV